MDSFRDAILKLHREGYCMIPSGKGTEGKSPSMSWKPYQERQSSEEEIRDWMRLRKPVLWGLVTGEVSGVVIVDCDPGADQAIMDGLEPHIKTPRGGGHYWFEHPGKPIKTCAGVLPKIDIRGDGGFANTIGKNPLTSGEYVIEIMPTRDNLYKWEQMPKAILEVMEGSKERAEPEPGAPILKDVRDNTLASMGGAARRVGATEEEIEAFLLKTLDRVEQIPGDEITEADVKRIAHSVARYDPDDSSHNTDTGNADS